MACLKLKECFLFAFQTIQVLLPGSHSAQSYLSPVLVGCLYPSKAPRTAGEARRPEGAGTESLLLKGHCPQSNLACSQVNLFKLVSESNPAAHKHLLRAYYVQGMALNALWLSTNAEVVGFQGG